MMTRRVQRRWLVAAALGYVLLLVAVTTRDGSRRWQLQLDRERAVAAAHRLAAEHGLSTAGWKATVAAQRDEVLERYLEQGAVAGPPLAWLSPLRLVVELQEPAGARSLRAVFTAGGQVAGLELRPRQAAAAGGAEARQEVAERGLRRLVGEQAADFALIYHQGDQFRWQWRPDAAGDLKVTALVEVRGVHPEHAELSVQLTEAAAARLDERLPAADLRPLRFALLGLAALVLAVQWLRYRQPQHAAVVLALVVFALSGVREGLTFEQRLLVVDGALEHGRAALFDSMLLSAGSVWLLLSAGAIAVRRWRPPAVESLELLSYGRLVARKVSRSLTAGLLAGGVVAAAGYLPALLGLPLAPWAGPAALAATAAARSSWVVLLPPAPLALLAAFAFVIPGLHVLLPRPRLARLLGLVVAALVLASELPAAGPLPVRWLAGLLVAVVAEQVYRRFDLLAVLTAGYAGAVAIGAAALLRQPGPLRLSGLLVLAALGLAVAFAWTAARRGPRLLLAPRLLVPRRRLHAQREQIQAELSLARQAQMRMLPAAPPELAGYRIAASCRPAREVGGDLYEFLPAPGCLHLIVGDVSGKGMVAALYMTLTRGLLLAAAEHRQELGALLSEVNRGLYQISERRIFVTLFCGRLHPASGELTYVRAGHNPALWRRAARRETVALKAPGLPLGVTRQATFDRRLSPETVRLEPGDGLFIYSDGLSEAMDEARREYGEERLWAAVARTDGLDAEQALGAILADVQAFIGDAPQHDDMTLVVVRVAGAGRA